MKIRHVVACEVCGVEAEARTESGWLGQGVAPPAGWPILSVDSSPTAPWITVCGWACARTWIDAQERAVGTSGGRHAAR